MGDITNSSYIILPFNFERIKNHSVLIVNMVGEFLTLLENDFKNLLSYKLNQNSELFYRLKAKHFITDSLSDPAIELLPVKYRTKKEFLSEFTTLHMFVVTLRCNHKCSYCHASSKDIKTREYDMDINTAQKAVDICLMSPAKSIKIEFQGGEPLLNYETVKYIIDYASKEASKREKNIEFVVCTNLTLITDEMLQYFTDKNVLISTSLDGSKHIHNFNRHYRDGKGSYDDVIKALEKVRRYVAPDRISALMTTTKYSLDYPQEIADEYMKNGFSSIFVRSLNPFGYAFSNIKELGYSAKEFISFYKSILEYIITTNLKGNYFEEAFASILLTRILTPFSTGFVDLQFPAGVGISGVIYNYNGNVYPSDEARMLAQMGDNSFYLGNVHSNTHKELFYGTTLRNIIENSLAEILPGCSDCAFQNYCGIDPIRNYLKCKDIIGHIPTSELCLIHKEIFKYLFEIILHNKRDKMDVFWSWLTGRNILEIRIDSRC